MEWESCDYDIVIVMVDKAFKTSLESRYQNSIKQNEIVGRVLSGSQVISL